MDLEEKKKQAYRRGEVVMLMLAVLTIGEFLLGYYASLWWMPILAIGVLKAFFIIRDYMHVGRVFATSEEEVH